VELIAKVTMVRNCIQIFTTTLTLAAALTLPMQAYAAGRDSQRLARAKDYIADEQWSRAVVELRAAVADPKEKSKDEALYWLAHSLNQAGDSAAALATIRRLEQDFPSSLWVKPAGSLRLDIAYHLGRHDVLWWTVAPPSPPPAPMTQPPTPNPARPVKPAPARPNAWFPEWYNPDVDLRIQALQSLIRTDALRVIPILKEIALDSDNPGQARRALFVLAQSGRPEARDTVVEVAKSAPEPVRIAAVRELSRFTGPEIAQELLRVYSTANTPVKQQVVWSLGERAERTALLRIAQSEKDPHLRDTAIVTLGQAGGGEQLRVLYQRASAELKRPIIVGFFNARQEEDLIRIADQERDPALRAEALVRLQLMGTPKAREYLQKINRNR
jgi:hypothetical protein